MKKHRGKLFVKVNWKDESSRQCEKRKARKGLEELSENVIKAGKYDCEYTGERVKEVDTLISKNPNEPGARKS